MCMSIDPTDDERRNLTTVGAVADWVSIQGTSSDAATPRGSLFRHLGISSTDHPRILGYMPADDYDAALQNWRIGAEAATAAAPTFVQRSQGGLLGRTCRVLAGTELTIAQQAAASIAPAVTASGPGKRRLKMASVINQGDDNEAELMDSAAITAAYAEYKSKTGAFPSEDEELSIEQLSGLKALFEASRPPYCDFAVFGPYHHRIQKKIKMNGIKLSPSGEITTTEMFGPPDYQSWRECYLVFRTGCIMLNQISPAHLDNYEKHIRRLSERYNKASWALIYQADVRARLEHSERLLRQAKEDRNKAIALGNSHGLDLKRPWDFIWRQLVDDYSFWQREVIEPALQLAVRSTSLHQVVEQDAPVATGANSLTAVPSRPAFIENPLPKLSPKRPRVERMHKVGDDGFLTHNRRGTELCRGYQSGECTECDQRGFCKRNNRLRHQCAKCLSDFHGAKDCTLAAPKQPRANHGKGRGGKGGGGKRQ